MGLAIVQLANPLLATEAKANVEKPTTKPSKLPFIGGLFQPVEGRGTLDEAYARMQEINQTKGTFTNMMLEGRKEEAKAFARDYAARMSLASTSGALQKQLGELAKQERMVIAAPKMSQEEKDTRLEKIDALKLKMARQFLTVYDKTTPQ